MNTTEKQYVEKLKELNYDKVDDFVSNVEVIADEEETNKKLLIV